MAKQVFSIRGQHCGPGRKGRIDSLDWFYSGFEVSVVKVFMLERLALRQRITGHFLNLEICATYGGVGAIFIGKGIEGSRKQDGGEDRGFHGISPKAAAPCS